MLSVVTGASGFLGGVLVRELLADEHRVRAVDLAPGPGLEALDVEFVAADVLDRQSLDSALEGASTVYHLAAVISVTGDPTGRVWTTNVDGVRNTALAALGAGVGRFVHCSSIHAYDTGAVKLVTEESPHATSPHLPVYDRSKAAGEAALREVISQGLDAVICNPTAIIGPQDFAHSRMNAVLLTMFRRRLPALIEGGFDWVDVRDVGSSMIAAGLHGRTGENYLLPGHHLTVRGLADVVQRVTGVRKPAVTVPMWFARLWSPVADVAARRVDNPLWYTSESLRALRCDPVVSGAKAGRELGHHPRPIDETIADMYGWAAGDTPSGPPPLAGTRRRAAG